MEVWLCLTVRAGPEVAASMLRMQDQRRAMPTRFEPHSCGLRIGQHRHNSLLYYLMLWANVSGSKRHVSYRAHW